MKRLERGLDGIPEAGLEEMEKELERTSRGWPRGDVKRLERGLDGILEAGLEEMEKIGGRGIYTTPFFCISRGHLFEGPSVVFS